MSDANNTTLAYKKETSFGVLPATPIFQQLRFTGESLVHAKDTVMSEEIRSDRQRIDLAKVGSQAEGSLNFELSYAEYQELLTGALGASWTVLNRAVTADINHTLSTLEASGVKATGVLTLTGNAVAAETVTIGGRTYTWRAAPTLANEVTVGASASVSIDNLVAAIMGAAGEGTLYGTDTVPHADVTAAAGAGDTMDVTAVLFGTGVIATTEVMTNATWGAATLAGGVNNFEGVPVGGFIRIAGAAAGGNNGIKRVVSVSVDGDTLTLGAGSFVSTVVGATLTLTGSDLRNGIEKPSWTIERKVLNSSGTPYYQSYKGMMVNVFDVAMATRQIITGSVSFMGQRGTPAADSLSTGGAYTGTSSDPVMNGTSHVGQLWQGDALMTEKLSEWAFSLNNNLRGKDALGQEGLFEVGQGSLDVTGNISAYFRDNTLYTKLVNHDYTGLAVVVTDSAGNSLAFSFPRVNFGSGDPNADAINTDVMVEVDFTAIRDEDTGVTVIVSAIPAAA